MQVFISHCAAAVISITTTICFIMENTPSKLTFPSPRSRSTASPVRMGMYRVRTTVTAASTRESPTINQYLRM